MADIDTIENALAGALEAESSEDAAGELAPVIVGILERRLGSREEALEALPGAVKSVLSSRRRLKGDSLLAGVLSVLKDKASGSAADGFAKGLAGSPEGEVVAEAALAGDSGGLEELLLTAIEGLTFAEAATVTKTPAAMVEKKASVAFLRIAEALAGH